jgi:hypothetical protein
MIFRGQKTGSTFSVDMDNSTYRNGLRVTPKIKENHISRMAHPSYSPDISPGDLWFFEMAKQILSDPGCSSSDEIEGAVAQVCNDVTWDDVQRVFWNWIRRLDCVTENYGEYISELNNIRFLMSITY